MNARWIFLLPLESHLLRTSSGYTCPTVLLRWTWSISNPHRCRNGFQFLGKSRIKIWYYMINEWKKVVNAIMTFDTFDCGSLSFLYFLALSAKRPFATETLIQIMNLCIGICNYMLWKSKTKSRASWWTFSHKTRTGEGSTKVPCTLIRRLA